MDKMQQISPLNISFVAVRIKIFPVRTLYDIVCVTCMKLSVNLQSIQN